MTQQPIDLSPRISGVRAVITTKWDNRAYRPRVLRTIENYTVDTALDSDADAWSVEIGDPRGELVDMLRRDAEVRCQLFGVGTSPNFILTGLADEVEFNDDGVWTLTGRDMSALAMDSTVLPKQYRHVRAWAIVEQQAKELGFQRTKLAKGQMVRKVQHTDGSETYWEFWYRLYRKEKMWLWTEPNGMLRADFLNYGSNPLYYLGWPKASDSAHIKERHIPVEQMSVRKSTQSRVAEVWTFYHNGKIGDHVVATDPTIRTWVKKPRKVLLDSTAHTRKSAMKTGWEEIFEGKVGEIEYTVTIPDPGFLLKQNEIARLRIPSLNIAGDFFVVGVQAQAGTDGAMQQLRLRDRQMALTRRIPSEPKALGESGPQDEKVQTQLGQELTGGADLPEGWGSYFVDAANKWHGGWDFNLFLSVLLGICNQETGFANIRQNGGPGGDHIEWYPPPNSFDASQSGGIFGGGAVHGTLTHDMTLYKTQFANESGDGYVSKEFGVGPMQLTDRGLKHEADDLFRAGYHDEFQGGRWHPQYNIMVAAHTLHDYLERLGANPADDNSIWMGVMAYNRGVAGAQSYFNQYGQLSAYAQSVRKMVNTDPGYLANLKTERDNAVQNANAPAQLPSNLFDAAPQPQVGTENNPTALEALNFIKPESSSVDIRNVNMRLLLAVNNLGRSLGKVITITSGFRTFEQQVQAWNNMNHNPLLAANPYTTTSNHQIGEAVDCTVDGRPIGLVVPAATMEKFGIHCSVYVRYGTDPVHVTLLSVWG